MLEMRKLLFSIAMAFCLVGCQTSLYSGLQEKEATAMMAMLMEQGVPAGKVKSKDGWDLMTEKSSLPMAVRILAREGYPKHEYNDVGKVFGNKGLISSPQEDRIRYIYALSQEIA